MSIRIGVRSRVSDRIPRDAGARLEAEARGAIARSTSFMRGLAASNINRRTGRTARTIGSRLVGTTGYVGSNDPIAEYLERGTRSHVIQGRPFLRFNSGGRTVFARTVNHPGTRPYRWLERSGEAAGEYAKAELRAVFARVFG